MKNSEKKEWVSVPLTREQLTILEQAREEFAKRNEVFFRRCLRSCGIW